MEGIALAVVLVWYIFASHSGCGSSSYIEYRRWLVFVSWYNNRYFDYTPPFSVFCYQLVEDNTIVRAIVAPGRRHSWSLIWVD